MSLVGRDRPSVSGIEIDGLLIPSVNAEGIARPDYTRQVRTRFGATQQSLPCAKAIAISAASSRSGRRTCECVEIRLVRGEVLKGHTVELSPTAPSSTDVVASFDAGEADARVTEDLGEPGGDVVDDLSWRRASARGNVAT
jgi:hypothetical protein